VIRAAISAAISLAVVGAAGVVSAGEQRPYVVTAIDYHFHDAHPTFPIAPDRTLIVKNVGRSVHNVTFADVGFSRDVAPGEQLVIRDIGKLLGGPGEHSMYCAYHIDRGMSGVVVIAREEGT
jgi:plastocyanin